MAEEIDNRIKSLVFTTLFILGALSVGVVALIFWRFFDVPT